MSLSMALHIISLVFASSGLVTKDKHLRLKLIFWLLAYIFLNLSIIAK